MSNSASSNKRYFAPLQPCLIAPLLLVGVACCQLVSAALYGLTPWKGGGFGMFSSVDSPSARFLRIYLVSGTEQTPVEIPRSLAFKRQTSKIRALPSQDSLDDLAVQLAAQTWVVAGQGLSAQSAATPRVLRADEAASAVAQAVPAEAVRVELWRTRFVADRRAIEAWRSLTSQTTTGAADD